MKTCRAIFYDSGCYMPSLTSGWIYYYSWLDMGNAPSLLSTCFPFVLINLIHCTSPLCSMAVILHFPNYHHVTQNKKICKKLYSEQREVFALKDILRYVEHWVMIQLLQYETFHDKLILLGALVWVTSMPCKQKQLWQEVLCFSLWICLLGLNKH